MNDELLFLIPSLLVGLTMAIEVVLINWTRDRIAKKIDELDNLIERLVEMEYKEPECKLPKFNVGDVVIGNEKANKYYATNQGQVCIVDKILANGDIKVHIPLKDGSRSTSLTVNADCFDLVEHGEKKQSKFKVGDIVIGNEKAKDYAVTTTGFLGIVTAIEGDGLMVIKGLKYPNLSYTVQQECFDLFGEQQKTEKPKFKVGDVVTVRKEAEKYGIAVLKYDLIVSEIMDNGMIKVYVPLSNGEKSTDIVYNPEWLEPVERQAVDIPETEKPESIMERWANESKNFSETLKNLLKEFGFGSTYQVKYQILSAFSEKYIKLFDKLGTNSCDPGEISVIQLAKALLVVSAYLETDNIEEVIDWADRN